MTEEHLKNLEKAFLKFVVIPDHEHDRPVGRLMEQIVKYELSEIFRLATVGIKHETKPVTIY